MKARTLALLSLLALLAACGTKNPVAPATDETPAAPRHEGGTGFLGGGS